MSNSLLIYLPELFIVLAINLNLVIAAIYSNLDKFLSQQIKVLWLSIIALILTFLIILNQTISIFETEFIIDNPIINFTKISLIIFSIFILIIAKDSIIYKNIKGSEFSIVVLLALLGFFIILSSNDLLTLYLGIELYSLSLYILAAYNRNSEKSTEAGLKYLVLGSLASGIYLFGTSFIYFGTGELNYSNINLILETMLEDKLLLIGTTFIILALLFKLAAAPLHMWAPDVYEGSPTIVTMFFATIPKLGLLITIINLAYNIFTPLIDTFLTIFLITAIFSLIIGSITGLNQNKFKRLIAYSSITHIGFILIALSLNTIIGLQASLIYTFVYCMMTICMFSSIISIFKETDFNIELCGLSKRNNVLANIISINLFSIAGIPPLAGFYTKFIVIKEALHLDYYFIIFIAVFCSAIALVYYARIIKWIYFKDSNDYNVKVISDILINPVQISFSASIIVAITFYLILTLLFFPNFLLTFTNYLMLTSLI